MNSLEMKIDRKECMAQGLDPHVAVLADGAFEFYEIACFEEPGMVHEMQDMLVSAIKRGRLDKKDLESQKDKERPFDGWVFYYDCEFMTFPFIEKRTAQCAVSIGGDIVPLHVTSFDVNSISLGGNRLGGNRCMDKAGIEEKMFAAMREAIGCALADIEAEDGNGGGR